MAAHQAVVSGQRRVYNRESIKKRPGAVGRLRVLLSPKLTVERGVDKVDVLLVHLVFR